MARNRDITVVIPAYKAAPRISTALRSVHGGDCIADILVVEDGIFDDLRNVVTNFNGVRVITKESNSGAASARNTGLEECGTEFVFFLDSDDYVDVNLLRELKDAMNSSGADVAFGPWCFVYGGTPRTDIKLPTLRSNELTVAAWLRSECYPPCCVMWRTESLRKIGGWDASFRHKDDAELVIRAMICGLKLAVTDTGCGFYVQHDSPHRVSRAAGALESETADRIFQMVSSWEDGMRQVDVHEALGYFAYEQARRAYRGGESSLGCMWLSRARMLGIQGHIGTFAHRLLARMLGLGLKERIGALRDRVSFLRHRYK